MRDNEIYKQLDHMASAISHDNAQLSRSQALLRSRIDAIELLLLGSRFGILKMMILQLISPKRVALMVQNKHADQIAKFNAVRREAEASRPKIKPTKLGIVKVESNGNIAAN